MGIIGDFALLSFIPVLKEGGLHRSRDAVRLALRVKKFVRV